LIYIVVSVIINYYMFYQNSNDLVKKASNSSGHVQNSNETRRLLVNQANLASDQNLNTSDKSESLKIGTVFQNMIQSMFKNESIIEGMEQAGQMNNNKDGAGGGTYDQSQGLKTQAENEKKYKKQEIDHINRVNSILHLIDLDEKGRRQRWVQVVDGNGVSKYGYITKDGIFQVWLHPSSVENNPSNWLQTERMKQNAGLIGCPAASTSVQKINIAGTWEELNPYEMAYAHNDTDKKNPLFMIINTGVRDQKNTPGRDGLFSCSNESKNIFVTQRPSADFQFTGQGVDTHQMGCYTIPNGIWDRDFENRGWQFQEDLFEASISQCKRRAEDLGSSYFLVSAPEKGKPANRGGCWIYTRSGKPNISGILEFNSNGSKCYRVHNQEEDEDGFMKSYNPSDLQRLYGREQSYNDRSVALYCLKTGGLTGVDTSAERGYVGRISYIDYNGERRNYPSSALTFEKPTKQRPGAYLNLGAYDTRSLEDSYGLTQITPGKANRAGNLLYRGYWYNMSPQTWWRQCANQGPTYTRVTLWDGRVLGSYNSRSWPSPSSYWWYWESADPESFVYDGTRKYYGSNSIWGSGMYTHLVCPDTWFPFFAGYDMIVWWGVLYMIGGAMHSDSQGRGPFGTRRWQWRWDGWWIRELETYAVDPNRFPQTEPPEYERIMRTRAVGQSVSATNDQCREMCDGDDNCGGYVYTKGNAGQTGQCELKNRSKMYPIGLRVADPTKQLMLKVPTINASITDDGCKGRNGRYRQVDTAQFLHYPYIGEMSGTSKCDIKKIVPKKGSMNAQNASTMVNSVNTAFNETQTSIDIFRHQLQSGKGKKGKVVMYGPWIGRELDTELKTLEDGRGVYYVQDGDYTKMVTRDGKEEKYYVGKKDELNLQKWNQSSSTGGGKYITKIVVPAGPADINDITKDIAKEGFEEREGFETIGANEPYTKVMEKVQKDLVRIANSEYQRERLLAMTEETNKQLIAESYKFILWSILAILVVLALIKLKEMFGQDDADEGGESEGGILATIMGLFGMGKVDTSDIADKTADVKASLASAGDEFMKASDELSTNITQGADNLVTSVSDAANGAVEGAKGMADKVSETATDAVNKIGDNGTPPAASTTGGRGSSGRGKRK